MHKWLVAMEKVSLFLLSLAIVAYVILQMNFILDFWKELYLGAGDIEMFIYLMIALFLISFVFRKLLVWEIHALFSPKKRRRR